MPRRKGTTTARSVDFYQMYYDFWDVFNCNISDTLIAYHLYDKTTSNGTPSSIWKSNKNKHHDDYEQAKQDYFQSLGITRECLVLRINTISLNARSDMTRLEATKYLYEILDRMNDAKQVSQAQKLVISFENVSEGDSNEG